MKTTLSSGITWDECNEISHYDVIVLCGCSEHLVTKYSGIVIHWRGLHWLPICAFNKAVQETFDKSIYSMEEYDDF